MLQYDTISQKLFTAALQWIMIDIHVDQSLPNLRFADGIDLFSNSAAKTEAVLDDLNEARKRVRPRIIRRKAQVMKNVF